MERGYLPLKAGCGPGPKLLPLQGDRNRSLSETDAPSEFPGTDLRYFRLAKFNGRGSTHIWIVFQLREIELST